MSGMVPGRSCFELIVLGSTLKAALHERLERESLHEPPEVPTDMEGMLNGERTELAEGRRIVKFIADNLQDDGQYKLTLADMQDLLAVKEPVLPKIISGIMPMISLMGPRQ